MIYGKYLTSRDDCAPVMALRRRVFVEEQGLDGALEIDRHDDMAVYALVFDEAGAAVGTGRLVVDEDRFTIGRLCVLPEKRGQGFGDLLMRMLLLRAQALGAASVWLKAPPALVPFCARYGLKPLGEIIREQDGPRRLMRAMAAELTVGGHCQQCGACSGGCAGCASGAGSASGAGPAGG